MIEIKFRAWNKKEKKMWSWSAMDRNKIFALDSRLPDKESWIAVPNHQDITLMQFIGRKDKNGKEAYHKDRVEFWTVDLESGHADKWAGTIEWDEEDLCWYVLNDNESWPCVKFRFINYFEVIGNIYEKELQGEVVKLDEQKQRNR